jgi:hypothetical protein
MRLTTFVAMPVITYSDRATEPREGELRTVLAQGLFSSPMHEVIAFLTVLEALAISYSLKGFGHLA